MEFYSTSGDLFQVKQKQQQENKKENTYSLLVNKITKGFSTIDFRNCACRFVSFRFSQTLLQFTLKSQQKKMEMRKWGKKLNLIIDLIVALFLFSVLSPLFSFVSSST